LREVHAEHVVALPGEKQRELAGSTPDVEHRTPDESGVGQLHERPLGASDVPVRNSAYAAS